MAWWIVKAILAPILYVVWRPWAEGAGNVPRRGPAILASNHLSFADHFFGPLPLRRRIVFLGKAEYFTGRGLKGLLTKAFFKSVGVIPLDRTGGKASEAALHTGLRVLREGKLLGIYPEGTRAPDNRLYRGKTGVARLALEARVPVVPMAMINTFELMPTGEKPRLGIRPGVRFGEPLDFSKYYGMEEDRAVLRTITDEIMQALQRLSGQEYVDRYAAEVKAELQGTAQPQEDPLDALHAPADGERAARAQQAPAQEPPAQEPPAQEPPAQEPPAQNAADEPAEGDSGRRDTSVRAPDNKP
ncbi:MAG TPA: lysophospholipid acyltransferase family protein [Streptosporangiaceae bacterium]|jgi:1-acyl-sn-glycerol-3-phosphate acyltransferase|nr:lysophospholipid acyltransferase family protein [Streptosporangiaceae bacterium]